MVITATTTEFVAHVRPAGPVGTAAPGVELRYTGAVRLRPAFAATRSLDAIPMSTRPGGHPV